MATDSVTRGVVGTAVVTTTTGVRQGSTRSYLVFVVFVNALIGIIEAHCGVDGILGWLHILMLIDLNGTCSSPSHGEASAKTILPEHVRGSVRHA